MFDDHVMNLLRMSGVCLFENLSRDNLAVLKFLASCYVKTFKAKIPIKIENGSLVTYYFANNPSEGNIEIFLKINGAETTHKGVDWFLCDSLFLYDIKLDNGANQSLKFDTCLQNGTLITKYYSTGCEEITLTTSTTLEPFTCELVENTANKCNVVLSNNFDRDSCHSLRKLVHALKGRGSKKSNDLITLCLSHKEQSATWEIDIASENNTAKIEVLDDSNTQINRKKRIIKAPTCALSNIAALISKVTNKKRKRVIENESNVRLKLLTRESKLDIEDNIIVFNLSLKCENLMDSTFIYSMKSSP